MTSYIKAMSGHQMCVQKIEKYDLPHWVKHYQDGDNFIDQYTSFYEVRNWDSAGHVFFYLGKGNPSMPRQIVGWYANSGRFWSGCGTTFKIAIDGLQEDGWIYA